MKRDTVVFIDGAYLSKIAYALGGGNYLQYNIHQLSINLAKKKGLWCEDIYYYTAPPYQSSPPLPEEIERKRKYDKFIKKIQTKKPTTWVKEGRLQKIGDVFKQKGVDVLLSADLLRAAQRRELKHIVLITADTDFVPTIEMIKKDYGVNIILAYYTDKKRRSPFSMSNHLWKACLEKIFIRREDFFVPEKIT